MEATENPFQPVSPTPNNSPVIKVIGVGGAGGNALSHMIRQGLRNVDFIAVNTDIKALNQCTAPYRIQLGDRGTGAGTRPDVGRELAIDSKDALKEAIQGADMLFIAAGMGGGTGTGATPIIAEIARELEIITVAVVTKPFTAEGIAKMKVASDAVSSLEKIVNSLIVVQNDALKKELPAKVKMKEALAAADNVLYNAVSSVSDIITQEGYMQLDFADVCEVMGTAGVTMMGSATTEGEDRAINAADAALRSPLLEGVELKNARGVLVSITAAEDSLELGEFETILSKIRECAVEEALVKAGLVYDASLGDKIKVTLLITGLGLPDESGIRPVARHSHELPREDARGNPIINASGQRISSGAMLSKNPSATSTFQPSITPVFGKNDAPRSNNTEKPKIENNAPTPDLVRSFNDMTGVVFRKNPTRGKTTSTESPQHELSQAKTMPEDSTQHELSQAKTMPEDSTRHEFSQAKTMPEDSTRHDLSRAKTISADSTRHDLSRAKTISADSTRHDLSGLQSSTYKEPNISSRLNNLLRPEKVVDTPSATDASNDTSQKLSTKSFIPRSLLRRLG